MSSEECKEMLADEYEDTNIKDWKRVAKYKNTLDMTVRQFNHPEVGNVWLLDDRGENDIFGSEWSPMIAKKGTVSAASYLFSIKEGMTYPGNTDIILTSVAHYEATGYSDDRHDVVAGTFLPTEWDACEETEGVWSVKVPVQEAIAGLLAAGFQRSDAHDLLWEGVSTLIPAQSPAAKKKWDDGGPSI